MQPMPLAKLIALMISLLGPAPQDTPKELQLKEGTKIVAIGDSITEMGGYLRVADKVLANAYPDLKIPAIVNKGISGQHAEDFIKRFQKDVIDQKPAIVTISVGVNDVWHRMGQPHDPAVLEQYKVNVAKMVDDAQAAGIKVILLSPTQIMEDPNSPENQRLQLYIDAEKQIAADKHCGFVDLHQMFVTALANKPKDAPKEKWLTYDGVHMNAPGNALMAIGMLRAMGVPDEKLAMGEAIPKAATGK